jgi:hypothetical protein
MNAFHRGMLASAVAGLFVFGALTELSACACCSDEGEYVLRVDDPISEHHLTQIQQMRFAAAARLYVTDAGEDEDAQGIASVSDRYRLSVTSEATQWRLTFRAEDGQTGTLTLRLPPTMTVFAADIHDGKKSAGKGPLLYKEWRCEGTPEGDGIFQEGLTASAHFTLVFQGRGNRCDNAEDFTHWRLSVSGDKAHYAFFGRLAKAAP